MVTTINLDHEDSQHQVEIELSFTADNIKSQPWVNVSWSVVKSARECRLVSTRRLEDFATSIIILKNK